MNRNVRTASSQGIIEILSKKQNLIFFMTVEMTANIGYVTLLIF